MPYQFELIKPQNLLKIRVSDTTSYIQFDSLLTINWFDQRGSCGTYLAFLPFTFNSNYRKQVNQRIDDSLYENFTNREEQAYQVLKPLLQILEKGDYKMTFYRNENGEYFKYWEGSGDTLKKPRINLLFGKALKKKVLLYRVEHVQENLKRLFKKKWASINLLD